MVAASRDERERGRDFVALMGPDLGAALYRSALGLLVELVVRALGCTGSIVHMVHVCRVAG